MRTLKFKDGVFLDGLKQEALYAIDICLLTFHQMALPLVLTSCRDGEHAPYSHHYKGLAFDIRVWDISRRIPEVCQKLQERLGPDYQVINEENHIHVEYDPSVYKHTTA